MIDLKEILVTGHRGRLGTALVEKGCVPFEGDVLNRGNVHREIMEKNPKVVINCAAFSDVDGCEKDIMKAFSVNGFATDVFLGNFKGKFVQISTDFVFDGKKGPYKEYDRTMPINTYGSSKLIGEIGAQLFPKWLIIRTTNLYSPYKDRPDFVSWIREELVKNKPIRITDEQLGNPTYTPHLAEGILSAIQKNISGILNIVGTDYISRFEFAQMIARTFNFEVELVQKNFSYNPFAKRPLKCGLLTDLALNYQIPLWSVWEGLQDLKRRTVFG